MGVGTMDRGPRRDGLFFYPGGVQTMVALPVPESGRVPRLAPLMALAICFEDLIRTGQVADYADLARLGHVSRARITQIMNLLLLAPDIQEQVLFHPVWTAGIDMRFTIADQE
jgi:hypothetical protein